MKTVLTWTGIIGVLFYVVNNPAKTAAALRNIADGLGDFVTALMT